MAFEISRSHHMNKATTRRMVEKIVASLGDTYFFSYEWKDDRLNYGHIAVNGYVEIADHQVRVCVRKSPLLPVSEQCLRDEVEAALDAYIANGTGGR